MDKGEATTQKTLYLAEVRFYADRELDDAALEKKCEALATRIQRLASAMHLRVEGL